MAETKGGGFACPHCGKISNGRIIDSRATLYGRRRRRECEFCGIRFTTIEYSINSKRPVVGRGFGK